MSTRLAEVQITQGNVGNFLNNFMDYIMNDVIIISGGASGLTAAIHLASKGFKTLIVESNNYLGGGFWIGGYLMNKIIVRSPSQKISDEIDATDHDAVVSCSLEKRALIETKRFGSHER